MKVRKPAAATTAVLAVLVSAVPARAALPASGAVTVTSPVTWTGHVDDPAGAFEQVAFAMQSTAGLCAPPVCDTFALDVPPGKGSLYVDVASAAARTVAFELIAPDGVTTCVDDGQDLKAREIDVEHPTGGRWTVHVVGGGTFDYQATARLAETAGGTVPPAILRPGAPTVRSARSANAARRLRLPVTTAGVVTSLTATLTRVGRPGVTVARGTARSLVDRGTLTLRLRRSLAAGSYVVRLSATDVDGTVVTARRTFAIRR